jgi:hypothetical protein
MKQVLLAQAVMHCTGAIGKQLSTDLMLACLQNKVPGFPGRTKRTHLGEENLQNKLESQIDTL